jgi:hypothetical protein
MLCGVVGWPTAEDAGVVVSAGWMGWSVMVPPFVFTICVVNLPLEAYSSRRDRTSDSGNVVRPKFHCLDETALEQGL